VTDHTPATFIVDQPVYEDRPTMLSQVTVRMFEAMLRRMWLHDTWFPWWELPPGHWERLLARQIEERRVRHWPRRVRGYLSRRGRDYASRLSLAYQALRGNHYCGDDDW
jgi:hypothetical protein